MKNTTVYDRTAVEFLEYQDTLLSDIAHQYIENINVLELMQYHDGMIDKIQAHYPAINIDNIDSYVDDILDFESVSCGFTFWSNDNLLQCAYGEHCMRLDYVPREFRKAMCEEHFYNSRDKVFYIGIETIDIPIISDVELDIDSE